jgi:hypothetical protein
MIRKIAKITLIAVLSLVALVVIIISRLFSVKIFDSIVQTQHMKRLDEMYSDSLYVEINDEQFVDFDLYDPNIKLNDIQILASHNSYKGMSTSLGRLFVGLGDSFDEARALKYSYQSITDQLKLGIRSMEFDLRKRKDSFMLTHVPLVDNSSVAPNFALALEEIRLYSEHNPVHIPIIILMEVKTDWMILDHALQNIETEELLQLDALIKEKLGDHLFQPADLMVDDLTVQETITTLGWPSIEEMLGKVIIVLHPNNYNDRYLALDPTMESQAMFIGSYADDLNHDYTSFIVHNNVDVESIASLIEQGYIVRTRIDDSLAFDQNRYMAALASGAQILTSDFTSGRKDLNEADMIDLGGYMIIRFNP